MESEKVSEKGSAEGRGVPDGWGGDCEGLLWIVID